MIEIKCSQCGSNQLIRNGAYRICRFCGTEFRIEKDEEPVKSSEIAISSDIQRLLQKCIDDPANCKRFANLILDIDPDNQQAKQFLK